MLLLKALVVLPFTFLSSVCAQSDTDILKQANQILPPCALHCMMQTISKSSCKVADLACVWNDPKLNEVTVSCVRSACTVREVLTAKNFTSTALGHETRDHTKRVSYSGIIGGAICVVAVIIRVFARLPCCGGSWGSDDRVTLVTMVPMLPLSSLSVVLANAGLGKDMWTVPFDNITHILQIYYVDEIFYVMCTALTKISMLLFYLRIFPDRRFRICAHITTGSCALYMLISIPSVIAQCIPISLTWKGWDGQHENGKCIDLHAMGWTAAGVNIVLDFVVVILPLHEMSKLKMSRRRKAGILFMFLGGIL